MLNHYKLNFKLGLAEKRLNVEFQYNTIGCSIRNA